MTFRDVSIQTFDDQPPSEMPDDKVMRKVLGVVAAKYPRFCADTPEFFASFKSASQWLAVAPRSEVPNTKRYIGDLCDRAEDYLRARRLPVRDPGRALLAAAIGCGDIAYILPDPARGVLASIGVADYGGRRPAPRWADIAAGHAGLLAPTEPKLPAATSGPHEVNIGRDIGNRAGLPGFKGAVFW